MALSDDTYQLLSVSYVLAFGHDLVTVPVHRPASNLKGSHTVRAADSDPTGLTGPIAAESVQTANDKLGIWQGHWDSHFHVGLQ